MICIMEYVAVFLPSLGVGLVFYLIMRWLLRGDRAERSAQGEAQADACLLYTSPSPRDS